MDSKDEQGNIVCKSQENQAWSIFNTTDCNRCNRIKDCAYGMDELDCPPYVAPPIELPIFCSILVLILGILFHLGWKAVTRAAVDEAREMEIIGAIGRQLEDAVDLIVQAAIEDQPFPEASYEVIHSHCGGMDLLLGAAFSFPLEPIARHQLAREVQRQERKRHGEKWRNCVRRKAGSTKSSAIFLDDCNPPGCLKNTAFQADRCVRWFSDPPAKEPET